jgi:ribonuclease Y
LDAFWPWLLLLVGLLLGWRGTVAGLAWRERRRGEREQTERVAREVSHQERERALDEARRLLAARETAVEQRAAQVERRDADLAARAREIDRVAEQARAQAATVISDAKARLADLGGLPVAEARRLLLETLDQELVQERAKRVQRADEQARAEAERRARDVVLTTVQRLPTEHVSKAAVTLVRLPNDDMKGRVIGRDGRNVKALESATGCDVLVDEEQPLVTLSCFDPLRREVARDALEVLIQDGRIQPARIEEVVAEARSRLGARVLEEGRRALAEAAVGEAAPEIVDLLGRLAFRTSYGQNVLKHSLEAARIAGGIAAELKLDARLARRAALFHDLGKAMELEQGSHADAAGALLRRLGEPPEVVAAAEDHHDDRRDLNAYAVLAHVGDAVSAARPGARLEPAEAQVQRLADLERLALRFPGVEQVYALQAGREVRVLVDAQRVSDAEAPLLARDIARAVEAEVRYVGEVRVTVVREVRAVEVAR